MRVTEEQIDKQIEELKAQREELRKNKLWGCPKCEKKTKISKLGILVDQYYEEPYSCMGGDRWMSTDEFFISCPKCKEEVRLYKNKTGKENAKAYAIAKEYRWHFGRQGKRYAKYGQKTEDKWE